MATCAFTCALACLVTHSHVSLHSLTRAVTCAITRTSTCTLRIWYLRATRPSSSKTLFTHSSKQLRYYLVGISRSIILVEIELSKPLWYTCGLELGMCARGRTFSAQKQEHHLECVCTPRFDMFLKIRVTCFFDTTDMHFLPTFSRSGNMECLNMECLKFCW